MSVTVNLDMVLAHPGIASCVKQLASQLKVGFGAYVHAGDFFKGLSLPDLDLLRAAAEVNISDTGPLPEAQRMTIVALAELLALAEGVPPVDQNETSKNISTVLLFISLEFMARADIIELDRSRMVLSGDGHEGLAKVKGAL